MAVREKYPQYADMPDDALGTALAAKYPEYKDLAAPEGNVITRGYQAVAEPVTQAVSRVADVVTEPLVAASRLIQGEPAGQVARSYNPLDAGARADTNARSEGRINPLSTPVVPQTLLEAVMMLATGGASRLAPALYKQAPVLARVLFGAGGGEIGNQFEGGTPGKGALIGGGGAVAGEVAGKGIEMGRRMLPGAKRAISLDDTRRVGADIADVTGTPAVRTPSDVLDAATGAVTRRTQSAADYDAALVAHRQAVADARAEAARLTREGRATQAEWWKAKQQEYQGVVDRLEGEARVATAGFQGTVDAMMRAVNERRRGQAAQGVHDVINRVSPQLATALDAPGAQGLRNAGAGGARRVLGEGKEAVARQLEAATPGGIMVPALSDQPVPIREAMWALSEIGAGRGAQFARNPLDRNVLGAESRMQYGNVADQIRRGLDDVNPGLGDVFQGGQTTYREGLAVSKALLEPNKNWTPTGDVNVGALATDLVKPRMRRALSDKVGPERYQDIADTVTGLPREMPAQRVPRLEAALPEPPVKPPVRAPVEPVIPAEPTQAPASAADTVMTALFGPQNRIQQGQDTLVNWPAVQKAIQSPKMRAELEGTPGIGADGYQQILRSVLRGATEGADVPATGSGRLFGSLWDVLSGREKGFTGGTTGTTIRPFLPNLGAHYVGKKPMQLPPALQTILDLAGQRAGAALSGDRR